MTWPDLQLLGRRYQGLQNAAVKHSVGTFIFGVARRYIILLYRILSRDDYGYTHGDGTYSVVILSHIIVKIRRKVGKYMWQCRYILLYY